MAKIRITWDNGRSSLTTPLPLQDTIELPKSAKGVKLEYIAEPMKDVHFEASGPSLTASGSWVEYLKHQHVNDQIKQACAEAAKGYVGQRKLTAADIVNAIILVIRRHRASSTRDPAYIILNAEAYEAAWLINNGALEKFHGIPVLCSPLQPELVVALPENQLAAVQYGAASVTRAEVLG